VNLTEEQFNSWGFDGLLEITLIPNVPPTLPGRFAINLVCGNSFVDASLSYTLAFPNSLEMELVLDGQPPLFLGSPTPVPLFLDVGVHQIEYRFRDCGGNLSTCSFEVTVEDLEPPALNCPPDLIVNLDPGECQKTLEVPLFLDVSDNCAVTTPVTQTQPPPTQDAFLTFTLNPNFGEFMADDRLFVFTNLQPTAAPGFVELIVELQGDVDEPGEFFTLIGPNNDTLGTTEVGQPGVVPGDCNSPLTATFLIPSEDFNNWASSGTVAFQARSFMSFPLPPSGPGLGINPCDPGAVTQDGQTDSISYMRATLQYQVVEPTYWAEGATPIPPTVLSAPLVPPTHTFDQGVTTISYEVVDLAGNRDTCSFDIVVEDKEPPNVLCGPSFVSINPSGLVQDTIFPADIDLGTSDNCTLDSIWVQPNRVTCDQAGSPINVTLFARDQAGNVDSCQTFVVVETEPPAPTVVGTCGSSDLQLMANPPLAPNGNDVYQYEWTGPNGFFSNQRDPLIQGADMTHVGFYTLLIRGITGCEAVGTVQIQCEDLPLQRPALSVSATQVCNDDPIDLSTSPVCGNVVYKWYSGTPPNGTLLGTTTDPEFTIAPPHQPGNFKFYVVVERNGCPSQASLTQTVTITNRPVAMPDQTSIT
ncbi:MAG: HYR domain-containing protein, partial [Bacteroidetes bacterium]